MPTELPGSTGCSRKKKFACRLRCVFKKNLNASKPSEHPPQVEVILPNCVFLPGDHGRDFDVSLLCCCCCILHINRSGLNHTQQYTWLPIRYVVCWAERDQRNIYQAPTRAKEKHKHTKNDKEKGTGITKYTGQRKTDEGHSIERVWL